MSLVLSQKENENRTGIASACQVASEENVLSLSWRLADRSDVESKPRPLIIFCPFSLLFSLLSQPLLLSYRPRPSRRWPRPRSPRWSAARSSTLGKGFEKFDLKISILRELERREKREKEKKSSPLFSLLKKNVNFSSAATPPSRPTSTPTRASSPPPSPPAPPPESTRLSSSATVAASTWARASRTLSTTSTS